MIRPIAASVAAAALAVPLLTGPAVAHSKTPATEGSLQGLTLVGGCPGEPSQLKNVTTTPRTPFLFFPMSLWDSSTRRFTGKWLFPYTITIAGEGLKARHLGPGEVYTRPGPAPAKVSTCEFEGKTADGPFHVTITGPIRGW